MQQNLDTILTLNDYYELGDDIVATLTITNRELDSIGINIPVTASGKLKSDIFTLSKDNEFIEYRGVFIKAKTEPVLLSFNQSIAFSFSLGREYEIESSGNYTLELNAEEYPVASHAKTSCKFYVHSDSFSKPSLSWRQLEEESGRVSKILYKQFGTHTAHHAGDKQFADLKTAHEKALSVSSYINDFLSICHDKLAGALHLTYQSIFCNQSLGWKKTLDQFSKIHEFLERDVVYHFGIGCEEGVYAYVYSKDPNKNIYLCDGYNEATTYPNEVNQVDTKMGVILHEMSHLAVRSKDHFYGLPKCISHALKCNLATTTTNADCIQYFGELTFLGMTDKDIEDEL